MRLMLGENGSPSLLVDVIDDYLPAKFDFYVVNGAWFGTLTDNLITVHQPEQPWSSLVPISILSDNQDRLCGSYQTVFDNWDNPQYAAPSHKPLPHEWDDDIPF